jgi:beta-phosphoglucomutase-like phosphatase (HAD superfamily)
LALLNDNSTRIALPGAIAFIEKAKQLDLKIALGSASQNAPLVLENYKLPNTLTP